jgi:hypothetical protein
MRAILLLMTFGLALGLTGCVDRASVQYGDGGKHGYKEGPPPHAPAHGYRAKHHHHDLRYDAGLGVYVVLGYDDHFFLDDLYFRYRSGHWQASASLDDGWRDCDENRVPSNLRYNKRYKKAYRDYDDQDDQGHKGKGKYKDKKSKYD